MEPLFVNVYEARIHTELQAPFLIYVLKDVGTLNDCVYTRLA